ncbi:MAG: hypothetical protein JHD16_01850 [Solirubrobacteraceae bacterium]|nr:hypothetical protein [Solirubrobacteraceae bacterium]
MSPNQRALLVAATEKDPNCYDSKPELIEATASRIRVRMKFVLEDDVDPNADCPETDVSLPPRTHRLNISRKIRGQGISGPGLVKPGKVIARFRNGAQSFSAHSVVGLRVRYALPILDAWGFGTRTSIVGPHSGYVASSNPRFPRTFTESFDVTLTTVRLPN